MPSQAHHQRAIDRLWDAHGDDRRFDALIIGGSVAKGFARPDSDVDFLIVATDEEFSRRRQEGDLFINRTDLPDCEGGYVDGKIIDRAYLEALAAKGNEPSRARSTRARGPGGSRSALGLVQRPQQLRPSPLHLATTPHTSAACRDLS